VCVCVTLSVRVECLRTYTRVNVCLWEVSCASMCVCVCVSVSALLCVCVIMCVHMRRCVCDWVGGSLGCWMGV